MKSSLIPCKNIRTCSFTLLQLRWLCCWDTAWRWRQTVVYHASIKKFPTVRASQWGAENALTASISPLRSARSCARKSCQAAWSAHLRRTPAEGRLREPQSLPTNKNTVQITVHQTMSAPAFMWLTSQVFANVVWANWRHAQQGRSLTRQRNWSCQFLQRQQQNGGYAQCNTRRVLIKCFMFKRDRLRDESNSNDRQDFNEVQFNEKALYCPTGRITRKQSLKFRYGTRDRKFWRNSSSAVRQRNWDIASRKLNHCKLQSFELT